MRIGIIGNGVVGGTLRRWFERNTRHEIVIYDPPQGHTEPIGKCDVAFISVPVPTKGMKQDLSLLIEGIGVAQACDDIFVRSSVLPGTCDAMSRLFGRPIMAMPEFLTERTCDQDMETQSLMIGLPVDDVEDGKALASNMRGPLISLFGERAMKIVFSEAKNCELAKYAHNCFGALKVTYFNAISELCRQEGVDYESVRSLMLMSGYINDTHTLVPGPDGKRGFGGKCFPKDLAAFIGWVGSNPAHALLKDVLCLNRFYRGEKDFDDGTEEAKEAM
jgi:UDPglucose 6-dehydrogenase